MYCDSNVYWGLENSKVAMSDYKPIWIGLRIDLADDLSEPGIRKTHLTD